MGFTGLMAMGISILEMQDFLPTIPPIDIALDPPCNGGWRRGGVPPPTLRISWLQALGPAEWAGGGPRRGITP